MQMLAHQMLLWQLQQHVKGHPLWTVVRKGVACPVLDEHPSGQQVALNGLVNTHQHVPAHEGEFCNAETYNELPLPVFIRTHMFSHMLQPCQSPSE